MTRKEYVDKYREAVLEACNRSTLFPSVMMAQAILESGVGESKLAKYFNNHFGIKAGLEWKGKRTYMTTREVVNGQEKVIETAFRFYTDPKDSFLDRNRLLKVNSRYARVFEAGTPEAQCRAIFEAGYATDPSYPDLLMSLIRTLGLTSLDKQAEKNAYAAAA